MTIIQDFIPVGRGNRPGRVNPMLYITIHETGNTDPESNAKSHAAYLKSDTAANLPVSWHYTVDDSVVYQHLPDDEDAFHAGDGNGSGNRQSIGIEICVNSEGNLLKAADNAALLTAMLCNKHSIPIEKTVQHNHWSGKNCPQTIRAGKPYTWVVFIDKVREHLQEIEENEGMITREQFKAMLIDALPEVLREITPIYNTVDEVPDWGRATIEKLIARGLLQGNGKGLDLSRDMVRQNVILDRAGLLGLKPV
jgi:N-acetylmuramoyl-L-alanine amidase